ncbi:MAG: spermidine/putrescine ABC transporter substrate-binding protein, partial [Lachnospiraceae bacterium]|nr:spermidine/putrescine ABC transporter substrate-binding protein [Lachnospiraceae bacterium]
MRRRVIAGLLTVCMMLPLVGCSKKEQTASDEIVLRVANCEEYIDEGDWDEDETIELEDGTEILGENALVDDFEEWYEET